MDAFQQTIEVKPHPRILFHPTEITEIRTRIQQCAADSPIRFDEIWLEIRQQAEAYAAEQAFTVSYPSCDVVLNIPLPLVEIEPVGDPPGYTDYPFWTMYSRTIEERIKVLSFAFAMTGEECFSSKVKEYLLSLSAYSKWFEFKHRGAEGNLSNAHFLLGMSIGYDAIFSELTDEERSAIEKAIFTKGLKPLEIDFENDDSHNIIASKRVAMFIGSLAILDAPGHRETVQPFLQNSYEYMRNYLDNRLVDPEIEGLLYLNVAARHLLMAADILFRSAGRDELIKHEYFRLLPDLFLYMMGTGGKSSFVNLSDSFYKLDVLYTMSVLASSAGHPVASWYIHQFPEKKLDLLLDLKKIPVPIPPYQYYGENSKMFPVIGWGALRSGWKEDDHLLAFNASESAKDHNHFDQNNFILHVSGEWLLTNPGYQDYVEGPRREFTIGTVGHNSMLVDGAGQIHRGRSRVVDWYTSENFSFVIGDAKDAYCPELLEWDREIFHLDQRYYVMIDRAVKASPESELSFLFHTPVSVKAGDKILNPGDKPEAASFGFMGEHAAAELSICYPESAEKEITQYAGAEQYGQCLQVVPGEMNESEFLVTLIQPQAHKDGKGLTWDFNRTGSLFDLKVTDMDVLDYLLVNEERSTVYQTSKDGYVSVRAEKGWVSTSNQGSGTVKFALIGGNELSVNGSRMLQSNMQVNASGFFFNEAVKIKLVAQLDGKVRIRSQEPSVVRLNGVVVEENLVSYDSERRMLELDLSQGLHYLDLSFLVV
ncbi:MULTISPECIES: heparinase II/III-family protein [unclassified Mesobacillus]|uniref:heparinase II/III family protein n=1 Tax=unclassified Mesobacillus TaxID=2675270 RepID=UPI00203E2AED|nr:MULTISPECIES: heparinase II/III-family protein [unclassified Mesobacillus]MCM3123843.1 heparinase II/III-family protein [Mesobacillus sp. MER 33]MCM3234142.1 heparinase II/III-family protein [Mesobacillus sp. MER 48]